MYDKMPLRNLIFVLRKRLLTTLAATSTSPSSFTVKYLIDSCGFSLQSAISTSKKIQLLESKSSKYDYLIIFFKSHGFDNYHISEMIRKCPIILNCKVDNNLKPKVQYLVENGFVGQLLPKLIAGNPSIVRNSLNSLQKNYDFLMSFLNCKKQVMKVVMRGTWFLANDLRAKLVPHIDLLLNKGLPSKSIATLLVELPRSLQSSTDRIVQAVEKVKKMGLEPSTTIFVPALKVMLTLNDRAFQRKVELFKSMGWSSEEVISTFKRSPVCFSLSEDNLSSTMNFYLRTMKVDAKTIIATPKFLHYSLDKRIRPRYNVLRVLISMNLLKESKMSVWVIPRAEKDFVENFVIKYLDQVPDLMEIFHGNNIMTK